MSWLYLIIAILFEVAGTTAMKLTEGFTRWEPSVAMVIFYTLSFVFLTFTLKSIEMGIAYATWAGVGTALIAVVGFIYFNDAVTLIKCVSIALIIIGVVGLNLSGVEH